MVEFLRSFTKVVEFKYIALAMLVLQNTLLVLSMSISRTSRSSSNGDLYASSTAVVIMELVKMLCCLTVITHENSAYSVNNDVNPVGNSADNNSFFTRSGLKGLVAALSNDVIGKPSEMAKLSVPALLYTVQNNLLFVALSNLDAATFQVGNQLKILTTAVFSYFMLGKRLSSCQWASLLVLMAGVSMAQLSASSKTPPAVEERTDQNPTVGFFAVLLAAMTSGFSGVYFERILKTSPTSIWMRNVQMGFFSILIALATVYLNAADFDIVQRNGFFHGYNIMVVAVILLQSAGGLVVAVVVKYADNILKGFAASFSIVTSCLLSAIFLDFQPTFLFVVGAVMVNVAMYMYATYPAPADTSATVGAAAAAVAASPVGSPRREGASSSPRRSETDAGADNGESDSSRLLTKAPADEGDDIELATSSK